MTEVERLPAVRGEGRKKEVLRVATLRSGHMLGINYELQYRSGPREEGNGSHRATGNWQRWATMTTMPYRLDMPAFPFPCVMSTCRQTHTCTQPYTHTCTQAHRHTWAYSVIAIKQLIVITLRNIHAHMHTLTYTYTQFHTHS